MPLYGRFTNVGANIEYLGTGTVRFTDLGAEIEYLTATGTVQFDVLGLMVEYTGTFQIRGRFTDFGLMIEYADIVVAGRHFGPAVG